MDMLSGGLALALALAVGLALGAALAALLLKSRSAGVDERLRGAEAQAAQLRADLDAARAAGLKAVEALRAETARRAGAEETAARVPGLEDRLAGLAAEVSALRVREGDLSARMEAERQAASQRQALLEDLQAKLQDTFKALSADALKHNNQNFVELAKADLSTFQEAAKGDLELRQKSIEGLVKPIRESLSQVDARIQDMEKSRPKAYVELCQQVKFLASDQVDLKKETRKLVEALRRPTVRGRWGEMQLRRVVELAGMVGVLRLHRAGQRDHRGRPPAARHGGPPARRQERRGGRQGAARRLSWTRSRPRTTRRAATTCRATPGRSGST